ncbi:MAG TPA: hypothetical protein VGF48_03960 [Thermoanaerobaculia bacterium]|jgi:hypothetical protein
MSFLHIHNGDVMAEHARQAEIEGEHLAFRESLVTGAPDGDRARTLAEAYGQEVDRTREELARQEQALDERSREVVLWFEQDVYCLIHLLYLLQRVRGSNVSYVWHPAPLAQLTHEELQRLFATRTAVTPRLREIASEAWRDYVRGDVSAWTQRDAAELPFLREGLTLLGTIDEHLRQFLSEKDFHSLFARVDRRLGLGDTEVLRRVRNLGWQG